MTDQKPDTPSSDYMAMADYWKLITALLGGTKAMRDAGEKYLPKFDAESDGSYKDRLAHACFTNIFRDIVENLAQRPFGTEVAIEDGAPSQLVDFCEDVDGKGNNLHVFAGSTFFSGIAYAVDWILVDHTQGLGGTATVAQEREAGVRPFWACYPAESVLAAYSTIIDGKEQFYHVRLKEDEVKQVGFKEVTTERVRVIEREELDSGRFGPARWTLWEKQKDKKGADEWIVTREGEFSIGVIPLVPFVTGRRKGSSWQFHPPMRDAADLQIEHYQQENGLKNAKTLTAFPMLSGNGIDPPTDADGKPMALVVGPATVLYAPSNVEGGAASWGFVEPAATSLTFLADDIAATARELRELGRQPLTAQSGNLTVITTAFAAQKGNSAVQAWALNLKDALENALVYTAMWLKLPDSEATVSINTDFDVGMGDDETFKHVLEMQPLRLISREAVLREAKRRGILDKDHDAEADMEQILIDQSGSDLDSEFAPPPMAAE